MNDDEGNSNSLVQEIDDRPEPAEIRSPSEGGDKSEEDNDRDEEENESINNNIRTNDDDDDDGHKDSELISGGQLDQGAYEVVFEQQEVEEENLEQSRDVINDADEDGDEDKDNSSPSRKRKRVSLDSDDDEEEVGDKQQKDEDEDKDSDQPSSPLRKIDSDDDDVEGKKSSARRKRVVIPDDSDDDDDDELAKLEAQAQDSDEDGDKEKDEDEDKSPKKAKKRVVFESDDEDELSNKKQESDTEKVDADERSRSPIVAEGDEVEKTDVIADIFGGSDAEDEDFEGFQKPDVEKGTDGDEVGDGDGLSRVAADLESSGSDSDDESRRGNQRSDLIYDFDIMMQKKREENYRRRKRKNIDIINDSDDVIAEMINQMKQAADDDFTCNKEGKAALCKLKLLPQLEGPLKKIDLREALLDAGILSVITDWLTPLPDRSLPNIKVRTTMLTVLQDFHVNDTERLKASGIGKAVMYLFKHPKETKENKLRAHRLIQMWSRPIFNHEVDFHSISREEREQRDIELLSSSAKKSRNEESPAKRVEEKQAGPGEKGFIPRARVPAPSLRAYVTRPASKVEESHMNRSATSKKPMTRYEKLQRQMNDKKRANRGSRPVKVSIEGRKM